MYRDRKLARDHVLKVRLSDYEADLVEALANWTGEQKATLAREFLMEGVKHALHGGVTAPPLEGAEQARTPARKRPN